MADVDWNSGCFCLFPDIEGVFREIGQESIGETFRRSLSQADGPLPRFELQSNQKLGYGN